MEQQLGTPDLPLHRGQVQRRRTLIPRIRVAPSFKVFLSFPTRPSAAASHSHLGSFFFVLSFTSWLGAAVYRLDERNVQ
ncbi:hypothetical protein SF12_02605 [Streptomyces sp. MBRL 601]|nr:hypothetical protein SF12_02605 [Streptomyces sp. MBRL 601]